MILFKEERFCFHNDYEVWCYFSCSDGFFFAVKEVPLLDQGAQGQQSIFQLRQVGGRNFLMEAYGLFYIIIFWQKFLIESITLRLAFKEIYLLSQFKHENIVRYLGTDKVRYPLTGKSLLLFPCNLVFLDEYTSLIRN